MQIKGLNGLDIEKICKFSYAIGYLKSMQEHIDDDDTCKVLDIAIEALQEAIAGDDDV